MRNNTVYRQQDAVYCVVAAIVVAAHVTPACTRLHGLLRNVRLQHSRACSVKKTTHCTVVSGTTSQRKVAQGLLRLQ
jgi:hypothetical protein